MKKIVRLTESDLTRIVRRIINEAAATKIYNPIQGTDYFVTKFGNGDVGYSNDELLAQGMGLKDPKKIEALNLKTGFNIPPATGYFGAAYLQKQCNSNPNTLKICKYI